MTDLFEENKAIPQGGDDQAAESGGLIEMPVLNLPATTEIKAKIHEAFEEDRRRREEQSLAEQAAKEAREADIAHRRKVNGAAVEALIKVSDVSELSANTIITAIADMKIPNVKISY